MEVYVLGETPVVHEIASIAAVIRSKAKKTIFLSMSPPLRYHCTNIGMYVSW